MAHNIELKLQADARDAKAGLEATARAAEAAAEEVQGFNKEGQECDSLARVFFENAKAVDEQVRALKKAERALKSYQKEEAKVAKQSAGKAGGGAGGGMWGLAAVAGAARFVKNPYVLGAAAAATGVGMVGAHVSGKGAEWEDAAARLSVTGGGNAASVLEGVRELSMRFGVEASELLAQGARLTKAGLSSEEAVKALESAVVAARGDVAQMEGILDILAESATRGTLEEDIMGRMEENGIELRRVLMKRFNMVKEEFDAALSAGRIDVRQYFAVIDELTGKGSAAQRAAEAAAESTGGLLRTIGQSWDAMVRDAGDLLNDVLVKPLANWALPKVKQVAAEVKEVAGDVKAWFHGDGAGEASGAKFEPWVSGEMRPEFLPDPKRDAEIAEAEEASKGFMGEVSGVISRQRAAAEAARWGKMTLAARRAELGRRTGLGAGVSVKGLDALMGQRAAELDGRVASGGLVYEDDMRALRELEAARELLVVLEEQEAVAKRQRTLEGERLQDADRRRAMMLAELEGNAQLMAELEREEALEKRVAEFKRMGVAADDAAVMAAEELDLERRLKEKRAAAEAGMRGAGWVQSHLAAVGGGGVSMRVYESQGLKVAQNTERNTASVAQGVQELLTEVRRKKGGFADFTVLQ